MTPTNTGTGPWAYSDLFETWKDDVVNVRNLYRDKKYRRCAVLCSEFLADAVCTPH